MALGARGRYGTVRKEGLREDIAAKVLVERSSVLWWKQ